MAWNDGNGGGGDAPQLDELLEGFRNRFTAPGAWVIVLVLLALWGYTGFYIVDADEVGVVTRFGEFTKELDPGPHLVLPKPIDKVYRPKVTQIRKHEIGFRTVDPGPPARYKGVLGEALMLTGDENIVDVWFIVQYRIKNPRHYLFSVTDPDQRVRDAAESAMRSIVGQTIIDRVLTEGRDEIQIAVAERLQNLLDQYEAGVRIERVQLQDVHPPKEVVAAFKDVASAREDKIKTINQADGYRNDLIPKAKGAAARIMNEAEAFKAEATNQAQGDVARFRALLAEYQKAPQITRERIYLETLEEILPRAEKVLMQSGEEGRGVLPILSLGDDRPKDRVPISTNVGAIEAGRTPELDRPTEGNR